MPETLERLSGWGTRTLMFHADNPLPPSSNNRPETVPLALHCDAFMIWSRSLQGQIKELGVQRVEYLPFAWDPEAFPYIGLSATPSHDVVFIGGWDREREEWLTPIAMQFDLKIWGPGYWQTRTRPGSILRRCWQGHAVSGPEAARILCDSRISVNILRRQNLPDGTNMRTFEVPGCGALAVSTRTRGALEILPEGEGGWYFSTPEQCAAVIAQLAGADDLRRQAAQRAHEIVLDGHQYIDRARRIIEFYRSP
jgi:spore maturation protein CgeB